MRIFPDRHPYYKVPKQDKQVIGDTTRKEFNRTIYNRLKEDKNYTDVEFNETTGGVKATHIGHNTQDSDKAETFFGNMKPADLERECQELLYQWGHSAVLRNEFANKKLGHTPPSLDIEIDGKIMDIRSITQGGLLGNALMAKNRQLANVKKKQKLYPIAYVFIFTIRECSQKKNYYMMLIGLKRQFKRLERLNV